jgi:hypothetical protein
VTTASLDSLGAAPLRGVLVCASRDPDAKVSFIATRATQAHAWESCVIKVATTRGAADAVAAEGRALTAVRRIGLGALESTIPRYVTSRDSGGLSALIATSLPGRPLAAEYHLWWRSSRRAKVRADFTAVAQWLREFQEATAQSDSCGDWASSVARALRARWGESADRGPGLLHKAIEELATLPVGAVAVHGDFWAGNILMSNGAVSGVIDWEAATPTGHPFRDPVRFALSYALYLDRHTPAGGPVRGHRGLARVGLAPGVRHLMTGSGWFPDVARGFLGDALIRNGASASAWYAACVVGIAEIAAFANDDEFARIHLDLLAELPTHPRGRR